MYKLTATQKIPAPIDEVWELFTNPANLQRITPANLKFTVISEKQGDTVFAGQVIDYKVSPVLNIPLFWRTEIVEVHPRSFFVDEQRKGPYSVWHHEHHFREIAGGVEMIDKVDYKNPLGLMGVLANSILVRKKLQKIFEFRYYKVEELLGVWKDQRPDIRFE